MKGPRETTNKQTTNTKKNNIMKTKSQNVVATSANFKQFVEDEAASHGAPSKSKDWLLANHREIADAMHQFVEKYRYEMIEDLQPVMVEESNEDGETVLVDSGEVETVEIEVDRFAIAVQEVLSARMDTVRVNSASAKLADAEKELAELRRQLEALQG